MKFSDITIGRSVDWKFGLITRDIYRVSEDEYEITDTSDGWITATVDRDTLEKVVAGEISLLTLNWQ